MDSVFVLLEIYEGTNIVGIFTSDENALRHLESTSFPLIEDSTIDADRFYAGKVVSVEGIDYVLEQHEVM